MKAPKVNMKKGSYDSGEFVGAVFVYELESGKLLRSYLVVVASSPELRLPGSGQTEADWMGMAMADLAVSAVSKVEQPFE